jgi:organic hydroperoxide reductase OsmC/OhrA
LLNFSLYPRPSSAKSLAFLFTSVSGAGFNRAMSEHKAFVTWDRTGNFDYETYDRTHRIKFEGGQEISGSAAPDFKGLAQHANPEETLAAAASACHMLTFLAFCSKKRIPLTSYRDEATAVLEKNEAGKMAITKIILRPQLQFDGEAPDAETIAKLHERAHQECFVANSMKASIEVH